MKFAAIKKQMSTYPTSHMPIQLKKHSTTKILMKKCSFLMEQLPVMIGIHHVLTMKLKISSKRKTVFSNKMQSSKSHSQRPFRNDEKCFLFHLKNSFRSQDIEIYALTFWSRRKKGLIRNIRLISKFMTSQIG